MKQFTKKHPEQQDFRTNQTIQHLNNFPSHRAKKICQSRHFNSIYSTIYHNNHVLAIAWEQSNIMARESKSLKLRQSYQIPLKFDSVSLYGQRFPARVAMFLAILIRQNDHGTPFYGRDLNGESNGSLIVYFLMILS